MRGVCVLIIGALGGTAHAEADCAHVLARLDDEVAEASRHPIELTVDGEPCAEDGDATVESGKVSGVRATVRSDGPHGSGRYWGVDVRVTISGQALGACVETSTTWWRNLPEAARKSAGVWHLLDGGSFVLWNTLAIGESQWESLALPLVYRISKQQLVLDRKRTTAEIARFGRIYGKAVDDDDVARAMHQSAAAAYAAFAAHDTCRD